MKTLVRAGCLTAILYLAGDAFFQGPVRRLLFPPDTSHLAARVSGRPVTRSQLDRALSEELWLEGKSTGDLTSVDLKTARDAALQQLIDHEILRSQDMSAIHVSDAEIDARLLRLTSRFGSRNELDTAMKVQGIPSERNLRDRLASKIRQEKFIDSRIALPSKVSSQEARQWYDANQTSVSLPERVAARHIFISTRDRPAEEAKQKLETALADLTGQKKDFPTLARELSEDPATRETGGELGWMTRARLPADFAAPLFSLKPNQPGLIRTKLGWHLVEVTARKPAEPRTFEQAAPEILAALEAVKRRQAIEALRKTLRISEGVKIEIFDVAAVSPRQPGS